MNRTLLAYVALSSLALGCGKKTSDDAPKAAAKGTPAATGSTGATGAPATTGAAAKADDPKAALLAARKLLASKKLDDGIKALEALVAAHPELHDAQIELGWAYFAAHDLKKAQATTQAAIDAIKDDKQLLGAAWYNLGRIAEENGDGDGAEAAYQKSLELRPGNKTVAARLEGVHDPVVLPPYGCETAMSDDALCGCLSKLLVEDDENISFGADTPGTPTCKPEGDVVEGHQIFTIKQSDDEAGAWFLTRVSAGKRQVVNKLAFLVNTIKYSTNAKLLGMQKVMLGKDAALRTDIEVDYDESWQGSMHTEESQLVAFVRLPAGKQMLLLPMGGETTDSFDDGEGRTEPETKTAWSFTLDLGDGKVTTKAKSGKPPAAKIGSFALPQ